MIITYLAAPLSPEGDETVASNIARAKQSYANLSATMRDRVFVADWILHCEVFAGTQDDDPELRTLGMMRNFKQIGTCHEMFLVGPRISRGMAAERDYAVKRGMRVTDLTTPFDETQPLTEWVTSVLKNADW